MADRHVPVLFHEVITLLRPAPGDFAVDGTLGRGGHAVELLRRIAPGGTLLGIDRDPTRIEATATFLEQVARDEQLSVAVKCQSGNYADLAETLVPFGRKADLVLLDLGFASDQLASGRGFSFRDAGDDEPLQMTYDPDAVPVSDLLNHHTTERELTQVLRDYGEERYAARIAAAILKHRPVATAGQLAEIVAQAVPKGYERGRIHPATRTFQALRIWANQELENLERFLASAPECLAPGSRLAIISFHSLEDRLVKNAFRDLARTGSAELLTKKPVTAAQEEVNLNPRARSAKLRAIRFL